MKVLIALASSSRQMAGVQRHGLNLARCLLTRTEISAVHLIIAPWQRACLENVDPIRDRRLYVHTAEMHNTPIGRNLWYYTTLPKIAAEVGADIVHLAYPMPVQRHAYHCPTVVTLHDLYPYDAPGNFGLAKVLFNRAVLLQCLRAVDAIACVSRSTHARLDVIHPRLAINKTSVILNCVEPQSAVSARGPLPEWAGEPFLLSVAQHRPNKNLMMLLRVFRRLVLTDAIDVKTRMVIVGIRGPETRAMQRFLAATKLQDRVTLLAGISDEELQWCYRNCNVLIAPSTIEGFGLPVAEALLAGCRVLCSDISAFREIGGDSCEYILLNEYAEQAFTRAVRAVFFLPRPAPIALPHLSIVHIGSEYLHFYRSLFSRASSPDIAFKPSISSSGGDAVL